MRELVAKLRSLSPNRLLLATLAGSLVWHVAAVFLFSTVFSVELGVEGAAPPSRPLVVKEYGGTGTGLTLDMTVRDILRELEISLPSKESFEGEAPLPAARRAASASAPAKVSALADKPSHGGAGMLRDLPGVGPGPLPGGREYRTAPKPGVALELKGERKIVFYPSPPAYPKECEKAGIEGDVVLAFEIAPSGDVVKVRVVRMSGCAILDQTAIEYIRKFRFNRASETTQGKVTVRFRFRTGGGG